MIATALRLTNHTSCVAALHADFSSFLPIYCPATTAPPVASAAKILMIRIIILSTSDTPDTAASPTFATIIESAIPTKTANNCSITKGPIRFASSRLEKR